MAIINFGLLDIYAVNERLERSNRVKVKHLSARTWMLLRLSVVSDEHASAGAENELMDTPVRANPQVEYPSQERLSQNRSPL